MMHDKHKKIVACLRKDARMPLTKMSKKIHLPVSTIFDRLKSTEEDIIVKHTCILNFEKLGYNARANLAIKVDKKDKDAAREYLMKHMKINSVFRISNGFDFMAEGIFRHIRDLESFVEDFESRFKIKKISSYFIVDDLKREGFLADPELCELADA